MERPLPESSMMNRFEPTILRVVGLFALPLALSLLPRPVLAADHTGNSGKVVQLTVNTQGSEKYASFHGSITVRPVAGDGTSDVYYWGGSTCPAQKISDAQVHLLGQALVNRSRTLVTPVYRVGQGTKGTRCLVAFDLLASS